MTLELAISTAKNYGLLDAFLDELNSGCTPTEALCLLDII